MTVSPDFPTTESILLLNGPAGGIEALVSPSKHYNKINANPSKDQNIHGDIVAIICHPHPLHHGTMNNKVVYITHEALNSSGCHTIRFNFRGVGRSAGTHDHGIGETADLMAIVNWVKIVKPNCQIILAGFSFGAFIALKASKIIHCLLLISIAPAIGNQDYQNYLPVNCRWLIIQGENDEITKPNLVFDLVKQLSKTDNKNQPDLIKVPNVGHFFHGALLKLKAEIINYLTII